MTSDETEKDPLEEERPSEVSQGGQAVGPTQGDHAISGSSTSEGTGVDVMEVNPSAPASSSSVAPSAATVPSKPPDPNGTVSAKAGSSESDKTPRGAVSNRNHKPNNNNNNKPAITPVRWR